MDTTELTVDSCLDEFDRIMAETEALTAEAAAEVNQTNKLGMKTPEKGELNSEPPSDGFLETPKIDSPVQMSNDAVPEKTVSEAVESSHPSTTADQEWESSPLPQSSGSTEVEFLAEKQGCNQCSVLDINLDQRHYFTHVRVAFINPKESIQFLDALHPNQVDSFTVHNLHHLHTDPIKTYHPFDQVPFTIEKRNNHYNAPKFLRSIRGIAEKRFHRSFLTHHLRTTPGLSMTSDTVMITYHDINNAVVSLDWNSWEFAAINRNTPPRHEKIEFINDSSIWVDSIFTVWLMVRISKSEIPRFYLTEAEQNFMRIVRSRVSNEHEPLKIIANLLVAHDHLLKRDSSHLGARSTSSPIPKKTRDEPLSQLTHPPNPASGVDSGFSNLSSHSRNGLQKPLFTPEVDSVAQAQMKAKLAENVLRRRNMNGEKQGPSCKKRLTFAPTTPVTNAKDAGLNVSTTSLENWQMQTATPTSIRCLSGAAITPEKKGNANLVPLNPNRGPLKPLVPGPRSGSLSGNGLDEEPSSTSRTTTSGQEPLDILLKVTGLEPSASQNDTESLMNETSTTFDSLAHAAHDEFDRNTAKILKRRLRQQRRRQKIRECNMR